MGTDERRLDKVTEEVIGAAFAVSNGLGIGFLEKVYENALAHELSKRGLEVKQQRGIEVRYDEVVVGHYVADLLVEDEVLVELKVAAQIDGAHIAQCINYLKATGYRLCLLLNFGTARLGVKRVIND